MATIIGTSAGNRLGGTGAADIIRGLAGNDTLAGFGGIDSLYGGHQNDRLYGGTSDDRLHGDDGSDVLSGQAGTDWLYGGRGNDTYVLGNGFDHVREQSGIDTITSTRSRSLSSFSGIEHLTLLGSFSVNGTGNSRGNVITGNTGANILDGRGGVDRLVGGLGNDRYVLANGTDVVVDSGGIDTITSTVGRSLASHKSIENLTLLGSAVSGTGNDHRNTIVGNSANNLLDGGRGADRLAGGAGNDTYTANSAQDVIVEAASGGTDIVRFNGAAGPTFTLASFVERLELLGSAATNGRGNSLNNTMVGNAAANILGGEAGSDALDGGKGNDVLMPGSGADIIDGGEGYDTLSYADAVAGVIIDLSNSGTLGGGGAAGDSILGIEAVVGSAFADQITTIQGAAYGGGGNDTLRAPFFSGTMLRGDAGVDTLEGDPNYIDEDIFWAQLNQGADHIARWDYTQDKIRLARSEFALGATFDSDDFVYHNTNSSAADEAQAQIIVSAAGGRVWYDPDGTGAANPILIIASTQAQVNPPFMDVANFLYI